MGQPVDHHLKKQAEIDSEQVTIVLVESPAEGEVETTRVQCDTCSLRRIRKLLKQVWN